MLLNQVKLTLQSPQFESPTSGSGISPASPVYSLVSQPLLPCLRANYLADLTVLSMVVIGHEPTSPNTYSPQN